MGKAIGKVKFRIGNVKIHTQSALEALRELSESLEGAEAERITAYVGSLDDVADYCDLILSELSGSSKSSTPLTA